MEGEMIILNNHNKNNRLYIGFQLPELEHGTHTENNHRYQYSDHHSKS
jgi:hypothetical protein